MKTWITVAACLAALPAFAQTAPTLPPLAVGQEWLTGGGAPDDPTPKILIDQIETDQDGQVVVHLSILNMPRLSSWSPAKVLNDAPFYEKDVIPSLRRLVATGVALPPGFAADYQAWRADPRRWVHDGSPVDYYKERADAAHRYRLQNPE